MNTLPLKKYYYLFVNKKTKKITGWRLHEIRKTQEEMDEVVKKFNAVETHDGFYEDATDDKIIQLMDAFEESKKMKLSDFDDITRDIRDIESSISDLEWNINNKLEEFKKEQEETKLEKENE